MRGREKEAGERKEEEGRMREWERGEREERGERWRWRRGGMSRKRKETRNLGGWGRRRSINWREMGE